MSYFRNLWQAILGRPSMPTPRQVPWVRLTPIEEDRIIFLHLEGFTNAAVARELGIKPARVGAVLKRQKERLKAPSND